MSCDEEFANDGDSAHFSAVCGFVCGTHQWHGAVPLWGSERSGRSDESRGVNNFLYIIKLEQFSVNEIIRPYWMLFIHTVQTFWFFLLHYQDNGVGRENSLEQKSFCGQIFNHWLIFRASEHVIVSMCKDLSPNTVLSVDWSKKRVVGFILTVFSVLDFSVYRKTGTRVESVSTACFHVSLLKIYVIYQLTNGDQYQSNVSTAASQICKNGLWQRLYSNSN